MDKYSLASFILFCAMAVTSSITVESESASTTQRIIQAPTPAEPVNTKQFRNNQKTCNCSETRVSTEFLKIQHGGRLAFNAELTSPETRYVDYFWSVRNGTIIAGQGTPDIVVKASSKRAERAVTATVVIRFRGLTCKCVQRAAASVPFSKYPAIIDRNKFPNVVDVSLDETTLVLPCEPGQTPIAESKASDNMQVRVETLAVDPENDYLAYDYKVSAGKILGKGQKVVWDLSDVPPGTYKITAAVDDGCGLCGTTKSQEVTVRACVPQCGLVICPTISLSDPFRSDNVDEYVTTANVSGGSQDQAVTYLWSVANGRIISSQGTPSVTVKAWTNSRKDESTVKINFGGIDPRGSCRTETSVTIPKGP